MFNFFAIFENEAVNIYVIKFHPFLSSVNTLNSVTLLRVPTEWKICITISAH